MTWVTALGLALFILGLMPVRMVRLHRTGRLTPRAFALTFAAGWALAILVLFYVGLADTLVDRRDPLLTALGLLIAAGNFALGYPIALVFHGRVVRSLLNRSSMTMRKLEAGGHRLSADHGALGEDLMGRDRASTDQELDDRR